MIEIGAADGARGVESEPLVNAVGVEDVVATGEKATRLLVVVELGDADSALERPPSRSSSPWPPHTRRSGAPR